jgi:hypothetical protein
MYLNFNFFFLEGNLKVFEKAVIFFLVCPKKKKKDVTLR